MKTSENRVENGLESSERRVESEWESSENRVENGLESSERRVENEWESSGNRVGVPVFAGGPERFASGKRKPMIAEGRTGTNTGGCGRRWVGV